MSSVRQSPFSASQRQLLRTLKRWENVLARGVDALCGLALCLALAGLHATSMGVEAGAVSAAFGSLCACLCAWEHRKLSSSRRYYRRIQAIEPDTAAVVAPRQQLGKRLATDALVFWLPTLLVLVLGLVVLAYGWTETGSRLHAA